MILHINAYAYYTYNLIQINNKLMSYTIQNLDCKFVMISRVLFSIFSIKSLFFLRAQALHKVSKEVGLELGTVNKIVLM